MLTARSAETLARLLILATLLNAFQEFLEHTSALKFQSLAMMEKFAPSILAIHPLELVSTPMLQTPLFAHHLVDVLLIPIVETLALLLLTSTSVIKQFAIPPPDLAKLLLNKDALALKTLIAHKDLSELFALTPTKLLHPPLVFQTNVVSTLTASQLLLDKFAIAQRLLQETRLAIARKGATRTSTVTITILAPSMFA
jgi:hypothetical protein